MELLSKTEYEIEIAKTRDARLKWWREARFGMFVHFGLYSQVERHEWLAVMENRPMEEYEKLADTFTMKEGAPREWAALAKSAGMKYMMLTTRHHEGFSLWDSKANPFNSVNYGSKRDIVKEFVEACREFGLKVGFYTSLMDWHHPDGWKCAVDTAARNRFNDYLTELNRELLTNYGKIDLLWFDVPWPVESWEGWNSLERNQMIRTLQPDIIMNDRSILDEDYGTPEENLKPIRRNWAEDTVTDAPVTRDWEACMTFNGISWGYVDSEQAVPYSFNAQQILKMLNNCTKNGGNLLLNIGPTPDGSVPKEVVGPLTAVGAWLKENGEAVYGKKDRYMGDLRGNYGGNGLISPTATDKTVYMWYFIWPTTGEATIGGYTSKLKSVRLLIDGSPVEFEQRGHRIFLRNLPKKSPDKHANISVVALEFEEELNYVHGSYYPQNHRGVDYAKDLTVK